MTFPDMDSKLVLKEGSMSHATPYICRVRAKLNLDVLITILFHFFHRLPLLLPTIHTVRESRKWQRILIQWLPNLNAHQNQLRGQVEINILSLWLSRSGLVLRIFISNKSPGDAGTAASIYHTLKTLHLISSQFQSDNAGLSSLIRITGCEVSARHGATQTPHVVLKRARWLWIRTCHTITQTLKLRKTISGKKKQIWILPPLWHWRTGVGQLSFGSGVLHLGFISEWLEQLLKPACSDCISGQLCQNAWGATHISYKMVGR